MPSPFEKVKTFKFADPVVSKDPVFTLSPLDPVSTVTLKVDKSPLVNVIVLFKTEAVTKESAELWVVANGNII